MMENQSKSLSPSSSLESELSLDTSSLSPSPNNEFEETADSNTSSSSSGIFSKRDSACSTSSIPEVDEDEENEEEMVVKEKSAIITTTKVGNGIITGIPEGILNEAKYQLKEASSELDNRNKGVRAIVSLENNVTNNRLNNHHHQQNNKNSEENGNDDDEDHHHHEYHHQQHEHHHHHSTDNALELNNQLNMLERILFPESHHKIITPRITITIDPSMVFDECEEEADSDDGDDEGGGHHIVVVAEEYDDGDDYSSVFLDELSSETGMSDKTLADLDVVDEEGDGVVDDLDEDIGVLDDVNGSSGSDGGSTSSKDDNGNTPGTITIDDSGIIITCEKYGKIPIEIINEHLTGRSQSTPCTDVGKDNTSNNSNANDETTGKAVIEKEQHDHKEAGTGEAGENKSNINSVAGSAITESSAEQQQETDHQSDVNVLSTSPQNHKLGRASSTPSNTNLSEPSSEPGESRGLKTEEVKPRRRNTIADIFRWYFLMLLNVKKKIIHISFFTASSIQNCTLAYYTCVHVHLIPLSHIYNKFSVVTKIYVCTNSGITTFCALSLDSVQ